MKLDFSFFAHAAVLSGEGGLFSLLQGGITWVGAKAFPATCSNLVLLVRLVFEPAEHGKTYDCVTQVADPDGNRLSPDPTVTAVAKPDPRHPAEGNTFVALFVFDGFTFPKPGVYVFRIMISDTVIGECKLEAVVEPKS